MPTLQELEQALINADKAGDVDAARALASDMERMMQSQPEQAKQEPAKKSYRLSEVPGAAVVNALPSAWRFASGMAQTIMHPLDTVEALAKLVAGGMHTAFPGASPDSPIKRETMGMASQFGQAMKDRYGGYEQIKRTVAEDPVGAAADVSTVLLGGSALVPKASKAATALKAASKATNPLSVVSPTVKLVGKAGKNVLGATFGTGAETVAEAARSGYRGKTAFMENLKGNVPMTDVLDYIKTGVRNMGIEKANQYKANMASVSNDKTILNFKGVDSAINDAAATMTYKGKIVNNKAAKALQDVTDEVEKWKALDPAEYHTPEGFDALKQKIGGILEEIPFENKRARSAVGAVYNSLKGEITKQAPTYAKAMKDYSDASELITEIERALGAGQKTAADTAMRKLQSLMRNNVQTNYGNRLDLARQLEGRGGVEFMPALAGQAMNSWTSRGLAGKAENLASLAYATHNPMWALTLPLQSPKLGGAAIYGVARATGLLGELLKNAGFTPDIARNAGLLMGQAGRQ
jgi:hypothetical protein